MTSSWFGNALGSPSLFSADTIAVPRPTPEMMFDLKFADTTLRLECQAVAQGLWFAAICISCGPAVRSTDPDFGDAPQHSHSTEPATETRAAAADAWPASFVPPSGWSWTLRVVDAESGEAIEWVDIEFARTSRSALNARDDSPAPISGPTAEGWVPICASPHWIYRVRSPGYAPTYGRLEADEPSQTRTTVRLEKAASIVGRVSFDGLRRGGLRLSAWLDDDGFGGTIYPELVPFDSRLAERFSAEIHETTSNGSGAFELTGLRPGRYRVRSFNAPQTVEQWLHVSLRAGTTKDVGEIHLKSKAE